ncbi:MAG TPA: ribonuclease P protein component [Lacipirellulaceae bacterium]|nr:ribonuclease P protein component [Lacipirellulaceae bacterium]
MGTAHHFFDLTEMVGNTHPTQMADNRFSKRVRLLRASDFERVFAARNSASDRWISLHGAANELGYPRLGLAVSRRVGGAVQRNRWKRLVREAFRLTQHSLPPIDLVCVPRAAVPPDLDQLINGVPTLCGRIYEKIERTAARCEVKRL